MKLKMYLALLVMGMIGLQSCNNDDDDLSLADVPQAVRTAFENEFSNTANLKWETKTVSQGQYYKAEFNNRSDNNYKTEVWYNADGAWYMTETEMPYSAIPQAIKTSFESSEYKDWKRDNEVERIERAGAATEVIYIIEVESAQDVDMDLIYSADGILIKAINDDGDDDNGSYLPNQPSEMTNAVKAFVEEKYPNARIVEIEKERNGMIEVDIIHENLHKEVMLSADYEWISTSWEVRILPITVTNAIDASAYSGYRIDDTDFVETPNGSYYWIELEQGNKEVKVKITSDGQFLD